MATKAKTSGTPAAAQASAQGPEVMLQEALALFQGGKAEAAKTAFLALESQAQAQGHLGIARTAKVHLRALDQQVKGAASFAIQPELDAQILINKDEPEAALEVLDKALGTQADRAILHYLKAVALAQLHQAEGSAQCLAKASELDPGMLYLFHLESDFDPLRHQAVFARFERY